MKVGIYGQFYHQNTEKYLHILLEALSKKGASIFIEKNFYDILKQRDTIDSRILSCNTFETLDADYQLFFSIGGDGTILKAVTFVKNSGIPIVGINLGRLGFLATIQKEDIQTMLHQILEGKYSISERSLLTVSMYPKQNDFNTLNFALNAVAVNRRNTSSMIQVETWINDNYLTSYWSDGLIVATPTGSTGYSLSCGGPIIEPSAKNFLLTPIAPHNLSARPLIVPDTAVLTLKVSGREDSYLLSLDSRTSTVANETKVIIKKADFKIKLLQIEEDSFIQTLRKRLLWGEDKRNQF
ncbi:MAG: NAD kinase [Bacteroidetes bacterium]|nr:NAD kinase [Bacteroidota bacterium]